MNPKKEAWLLFMLALIQFTTMLDFMVMMPLSTIIRKEFAINSTQFGILVASYSVSGGLISIVSSFVLDRFDRKKVLLFAYFFFIAGTFACAIASTFSAMLASRILTGLFSGVISAIILSTIADVFPFERRGTAMGKVMIGIGAAAVVGVPLGNFFANEYFWQLPFYIIGFSGLAVFSGIIFFLPRMSDHIQRTDRGMYWKNFGALLSSPDRLRALLLMMLLMFGSFSIIPFIPDYMVHNVGISQHDVTYIYLLGGAASIVMLVIAGKLTDRFGSFTVFTILSLITLVPIYFVTHLSVGELVIVLLATSSLYMFGGSRNVPVNTLITSTVLPQQRAGFMSLTSAVQQITAGLAAFIGSLLVKTGIHQEVINYSYVGWFAISCSLIAIPIAYFVRPIDSKDSSTDQA